MTDGGQVTLSVCLHRRHGGGGTLPPSPTIYWVFSEILVCASLCRCHRARGRGKETLFSKMSELADSCWDGGELSHAGGAQEKQVGSLAGGA